MVDSAKYPDARAALTEVDRLAEPDERGEVMAIPDRPLPFHAMVRLPPTESFHRENELWPPGIGRCSSGRQAGNCGRRCVACPCGRCYPFSSTMDPDCCPKCVQEVAHWAADRDAWWRKHRRRQRERETRREEREDVADWRHRQRYGQEPLTDGKGRLPTG